MDLDSLQFIMADTKSSQSAMSSSVLSYRLPTANVSLLLDSGTVAAPQPHRLSANCHTTTTFSRTLILHRLTCFTGPLDTSLGRIQHNAPTLFF